MENVRVGGRVDRFRANAINPVLLFDPLLLKDDSIRLGGKKKKESQDDFKEIIIAYKYNNPDRIIPPPMSCMGDDYLRSTIVDIISKPGKIQQRTHELDAARYSYYSKNLAGLPRNQVRMNFSAKQVQFEPDPFVEERKKTWNKNL